MVSFTDLAGFNESIESNKARIEPGPGNRPTTGQPVILGGPPEAGKVLTVDLTGISDPDGPPPGGYDFMHFWFRTDNSGIQTGLRGYDVQVTPTHETIGHILQVCVLFADRYQPS